MDLSLTAGLGFTGSFFTAAGARDAFRAEFDSCIIATSIITMLSIGATSGALETNQTKAPCIKITTAVANKKVAISFDFFC